MFEEIEEFELTGEQLLRNVLGLPTGARSLVQLQPVWNRSFDPKDLKRALDQMVETGELRFDGRNYFLANNAEDKGEQNGNGFSRLPLAGD